MPLRPFPTLTSFVVRGVVGFAFTSVAGFVPWAVFGHLLHPVVGEAGLYAVCAAVFMAVSGVFLHGLVFGPHSRWRFYALFTPAFALYALIWTLCWMHSRGTMGSLSGLLGGTVAMAAVFTSAFRCLARIPQVSAVLFVGNVAGYFGGGLVEEQLILQHRLAAMLVWGVCYGSGCGAGLGLAFFLCQARRDAAAAPTPSV